MRTIDGTESSPSYSFKNKTDTGLRWNGTNAMGLVVDGGTILQCKSNVTESSFPIRNLDGTTLNPYYSWVNDTDTGVYRQGANDMRITAGNSDVCSFNNTNFTLYKSLSSAYQSCFVFSKSGSTDRLQLTSNTWNNIDFPNTIFSQGTDITRTTSPNIRYTVNNSGRYLIIYIITLTVDSTTNRLNYSIIRKNDDDGNDKRFAYSIVNPVINTAQSSMTGSCILDLSTNDFLKMMIYPTSYQPYCPYGTSYSDFLSIYRLC